MARPTKPPAKGPPQRGIPFLVSDEAYAHAMQTRRRIIRDAADRLDRDESLEGVDKQDKMFLAIVLREAADRLSDEQPRPRGQAPIVDPGPLAMEFAIMVVTGNMWVNDAHELLSEQHDVSVTAIKKALKKHQAEALRMVGGPSFKLENQRRKLVTSKR